MNDRHNGDANGHPLVVENREAMSFRVRREAFVSREVLEREQRALFDHCWIYVGHSSELKSPGDFRTRWAAGRPVIFCRDRDGAIHCLINSCRHRGAIVCREREGDRKSTRLNSSHSSSSYAVFCLKKKNTRFSPASTGR